MDVNSLTIGEAKELARLFSNSNTSVVTHGAVGKICIIRTYASGVHFGKVVSVSNNEGRSRCELKDSRRIWYWKGAFTLSEVANNGVGKDSKLSEKVSTQFIEDAIEFIPCSDKSVKILKKYKVYES